MAQNEITLEGWKDVISRLQKVGLDLKSRQLFARMGIAVQFAIKDRVFVKGLDVENKPMRPYSPKYKKKREKRGLPTEHVDFMYDGGMWSAFTHAVTEDQLEIFFLNTQDKNGVSNAAKAFFLNEDRNWFGLTPEEEQLARDVYQDHLRQLESQFNR
jgi:hypothetical protein